MRKINYKKMLVTSVLSTLLAFSSSNALTADTVSYSSDMHAVQQSSDSLDIYSSLDELVITAKKDLIKSDGASITYDLEHDDSSKGQTLLDALRKVPMVTVDGQDKIYINGDSNFKIYVNGKEDPMIEANYSRIFKSMPADAVLNIEVITEPGAKYDAEGSGGILNLVTQTKQRDDGYSGSLSGSLSNLESGLSLFGRVKKKRFTADANVNYAGSLISNQKYFQKITNIDLQNPDNYRQVLDQNQEVSFGFINASLNASWEMNDNNLLTFGGSIMNIDGNIENLSSQSSMFDKNDNLKWRYSQRISGYMHMLSASGNASYQHNFSAPGHRLVLAYLFNFGRNPLKVESEQENVTDFPVALPFSVNSNRDYNREHTFQADYANPFNGEKHKLETGVKIILRHNSAFAYSAYGRTPYDVAIDNNSAVKMTQNQDIYAIYGAYTGHFGKLTANAGVRYEHTRMQMTDKLDLTKSFTRHLNDIVPNVALTYMISHASNLRLAYQMRISRPTLSQMNPYQMSIQGNMIQEGNINLESEHSNRFSLTYTNFGRILGGNVYIDYKNTGNAITDYTYFTTGSDNQIIAHSTTANIGRSQDFGLGGFLNVNASGKLSFSANGRVGYVKMSSKSPDYKNHGWTGNYGANISYTAPEEIKLSLYGGQSIHNITLQGYYSGWYYYGIGISRDFLKEKSLNVAINASNFLTKYSSFHIKSQTTDHIFLSDFKNKSWRLGISVTWNFGSLKGTTKQTDLKITNDDASSSGSSKSGNGSGIGI